MVTAYLLRNVLEPRSILIQLILSNRIIDPIGLFGVLLDDPRIQLDPSKVQLDIM